MKASIGKAAIAATIVSLLSACSQTAPPVEALRPVRTVELQYANARETNRYFGSVQARHEVNQAFRVAGKVLERRVDVGQTVREGDVLAVLDDTDYRLAEEAARQQREAATARERQADSDWQRMQALKHDGSVSAFDDEHAQSTLLTARAAAEAEGRKLELARNQVKYTVLRASSGGVVTSLTLEVGQVVAAGQPVIAISNQGEPEIVVDVPEAHLTSFKTFPLYGLARQRSGREVRTHAARTFRRGGRANANVSRPPEANEPARAAARIDGDADCGTRGRRRFVGFHSGNGDDAGQGRTRTVDRSASRQ